MTKIEYRGNKGPFHKDYTRRREYSCAPDRSQVYRFDSSGVFASAMPGGAQEKTQ